MNRRFRISGVVILLLVFVLGCSVTTKMTNPVEEPPAPPPPPTEVPPIEVPPTEVPPTEVPVEEPPPPPTEVPELEIVHVTMPAQGVGKEQTILDQVSKDYASEKRAYGGDEYGLGRWERPFLTEEMAYMPYVDIMQTSLIRDEAGGWMYMSITVVEPPPGSGEHKAIYGVELDSDLDGRGDILILADMPGTDEWTTDGVQVWMDVNADIGGLNPMRTNAPEHGDGYEFLMFDAGAGEDPDLAWARISSEGANIIEIAFKLDLVDIGEDYYFFLWGAWTFVDDAHPDWFDHHDLYALGEAGSPLSNNEYYPLKAFFGADNTCRGLSGWAPNKQFPGMCPMGAPQASGGDDDGGCSPENCCKDWPPTSACPYFWNPATCSCQR